MDYGAQSHIAPSTKHVQTKGAKDPKYALKLTEDHYLFAFLLNPFWTLSST